MNIRKRGLTSTGHKKGIFFPNVEVSPSVTKIMFEVSHPIKVSPVKAINLTWSKIQSIYSFPCLFYSYGSFGFWTAFLKQRGDVILSTGTTKTPTFLESLVRSALPRWIFLSDPCYTKDVDGNALLIDDCA
jgi:hypothetical protein